MEAEYFTANEIDTIIDIKYGFATNHFGGTDSLFLDAFFPNNIIDTFSARPVVIMVHGGGFLLVKKKIVGENVLN